jgi:hypothetical protein
MAWHTWAIPLALPRKSAMRASFWAAIGVFGQALRVPLCLGMLFLCVAVVAACPHGKQGIIRHIPAVAVPSFMGWVNLAQNVVIDDATDNNESFCTRHNLLFFCASIEETIDQHYADARRFGVIGKDKSFIGFQRCTRPRRCVCISLREPRNQDNCKSECRCPKRDIALARSAKEQAKILSPAGCSSDSQLPVRAPV